MRIKSEWRCRECKRICTIITNSYGAPNCPYPKEKVIPMWDCIKDAML